MILGIDHIAFNSSMLDDDIRRFEKEGYTITFREDSVPNNPAKKHLLRRYDPLHSLCLMKSDKGRLAIEITRHNDRIFQDAASMKWGEDILKIHVRDEQLEQAFWNTALGFVPKEPGRSAFMGPFSQWRCDVQFEHASVAAPDMLDDAGYTCLALISSNLEKDIENAEKSGAYDVCIPFQTVVNNRSLTIGLFRTPGGVLIELIMVGKKLGNETRKNY